MGEVGLYRNEEPEGKFPWETGSGEWSRLGKPVSGFRYGKTLGDILGEFQVLEIVPE